METTKTYLMEKYNGLCNTLEQQTIGTELVAYGVSGVLLLVAYAKRKPAYLVRQFKKPSHIPEQLINERVVHTGVIKAVQQHNQDTILYINHRPWLSIFMSSKRVLPVKLSGIKVNGNGFSWLQNCLVGREATFIPLTKSKADDFVICQMCLVHPPKSNKLIDISETLIKLRFANYVQDGANAKKNAKYYKHLQKVEVNTKSKESWFSWFARYPFMWKAVCDLRASVLPKQKLLPELVR
ncbi:uncharacterized protein LOC119681219 [Teleopsis dalmanni]|uniref:uncharacterized protein LOC119681219 n=1 Tax=Teleopsis dalmanni TaxID=139649 RepID=UPI0018CCB871|nr:uncharacterized protein LOC119681219 [Teleopsis dalmanni]XP_037950266.1 uncharacterized protein LOC119681219 [Teleopsis dalmanni]XP_037950267.1 uncharacterized protein LOC119681219 [Teleopsis dalmanni]XP_037950268.1 uncharacterized protein LOC119681219 [Teleopsis dalmanni]